MDEFIHQVKDLLDNPDLSYSDGYLKKVASTVTHLHDPSSKLMKNDSELLKEVGEIVQDILNQPLSNHKKEGVTMLEAAQKYTHQKDSELAFVMHAYVKYQEATKLLIGELELLIEDLKAA